MQDDGLKAHVKALSGAERLHSFSRDDLITTTSTVVVLSTVHAHVQPPVLCTSSARCACRTHGNSFRRLIITSDLNRQPAEKVVGAGGAEILKRAGGGDKEKREEAGDKQSGGEGRIVAVRAGNGRSCDRYQYVL